ncbi:transcription regulator HTH, apses-type DNA-binding domain-containing protein [Halenospora varia]|nr:transcription regulator HTH, apses-type DNA-binding domain-containing protein [Halenospora varia]
MAPATRHLPSRVNPLMTEEIPSYDTLVARRRLGQTDLAVKAGQVGTSNSTKPKNLGTFDYAHLRAPLPKGIMSGIFHPSPASYFLMRRSNDGYISATGMFKATFPYAEVAEEEQERKYVKSLETTSTDETAGNVWISPAAAIQLAEEYQIVPWIKALLDNTPIEVNPTKDGSPKPITSPPQFLMPLPEEALAAPTPSRGRPRRSASPSKIASPKKTTARARKAKKEDSAEPSVKLASKNLQSALKAASEETETKSAEPATNGDDSTVEKSITEETEEETKDEIKEEPVVRVNIDTEVEVNGDVETTHTHVEVEMPVGSPELPLPEDTAAMIAKAKEMVDAAVKAQNGEIPNLPKRGKRKADEIEEEEEEDKEEGAELPAPAKKAKVETELKKERVKTRALIGISATLALGAAVQYAFSVL